MKDFKPMLAGKVPADLSQLNFPLYVSPKIDGVRCTIIDGQPLSRKLKVIPNRFVQDTLSLGRTINGLDGELVVGPPTGMDLMQRTISGVMSLDGEPDFTFWVFDLVRLGGAPRVASPGFEDRYAEMVKKVQRCAHTRIRFVPHVRVNNLEELMHFETEAVSNGYEGIMLRGVRSPYKFGRSTTREQWLLKFKRWEDAEARIVGFEEKMHNTNEAKKNALGHTERSTKKEGMVPAGTLGNLLCEDVKTSQVLSIGSGLTDAMRAEIWANREAYLGKIVTYKHFAVTGVKDAPRFPIFKAIRHEDDI